MLLTYLLMYQKRQWTLWVIPQDLLSKEFSKKIYSLKVAHPATMISSRYHVRYLTIIFLKDSSFTIKLACLFPLEGWGNFPANLMRWGNFCTKKNSSWPTWVSNDKPTVEYLKRNEFCKVRKWTKKKHSNTDCTIKNEVIENPSNAGSL